MFIRYRGPRRLIAAILIVATTWVFIPGCGKEQTTDPTGNQLGAKILVFDPAQSDVQDLIEFQADVWEQLFRSAYTAAEGFSLGAPVAGPGDYVGQTTTGENFTLSVVSAIVTDTQAFAAMTDNPINKTFIVDHAARTVTVFGRLSSPAGAVDIAGVVNSGVGANGFWSQFIALEYVPAGLLDQLALLDIPAKDEADCRADCQDANGINGPLTIPHVTCPEGNHLDTHCAQDALDEYKDKYNEETTEFCNKTCGAAETFRAQMIAAGLIYTGCVASSIITGWFTFGLAAAVGVAICAAALAGATILAQQAYDTDIADAKNTYGRKKTSLKNKLNRDLRNCCKPDLKVRELAAEPSGH